MINKTVLLVVLLTLGTGGPRAGALGADELPSRAVARLGSYRFYHGPWINGAVLSPDGSRVASAAWHPSFLRRHVSDKERDACERVIALWDAATGERVRELRAPHGPISGLAFSPDGTRLAAGCGIAAGKSGVALFEVGTGKLLRHVGNFENGHYYTRVGHLDFSADGKQLRVSEWLGLVSAWDAATGKQLRLWKPPPTVPPRKNKDGVCAARGLVSPNGKAIVWEMRRLIRGGSTDAPVGLRVHDAETDKLVYRKKFERAPQVFSLAFSPDSKRFAADCDKLTVWETATGKELSAIEVQKESHLAQVVDWRRAVICQADSPVRLWDFQSGKPPQDFYPPFVSSSARIPEPPQAVSADGKTLLLATDSTLRLFDTTTGKEHAVPGHRAPVTPRFSGDGRTLFTACAERKCTWDVSPGKEPALLTQEPRKAWEIGAKAHSADDRLFLDQVFPDTGGIRVCVREAATGRVLRELDYHEFPGFSCFSPDATRVLLWDVARGGEPGVFRLYDAKTGKESGEIKPVDPVDKVGDPVFSPNGRLVAWADKANGVHLHDAVTGKAVRMLPQTEGTVVHLLFSPDSQYLIVMTRTRKLLSKPDEDDKPTTLLARVFQVSSGRAITRFCVKPEQAGRTDWLSCAAWSPDGRLLAVAHGVSGTVRLFEIASGKVRAEFAGHRDGVHGLAFSPDSKTLASGGKDNVVFVWDVTGARTGPGVRRESASDLAAWWADLAAEDAKRAGAAAACLIRTPGQGAAFLAKQLHPAEIPDAKRLGQLLADLNADSFPTREAASRELDRLGERAEAALRRALKNGPRPEARHRIVTLLDRLEHGLLSVDTLRALRAIEVLEHLGTPEAKRCLEALAKGLPEAPQTRDARAALGRLANGR